MKLLVNFMDAWWDVKKWQKSEGRRENGRLSP